MALGYSNAAFAAFAHQAGFSVDEYPTLPYHQPDFEECYDEEETDYENQLAYTPDETQKLIEALSLLHESQYFEQLGAESEPAHANAHAAAMEYVEHDFDMDDVSKILPAYASIRPAKQTGGAKDKISVDEPPLSRIFVRCSPLTTYEQLQSTFAKYGDVQQLKAICSRATGKFKGKVFVKYAKASSAALAKEELDGSQLLGGVMSVSIAPQTLVTLPVPEPVERARPQLQQKQPQLADDADQPPFSRLFVTCPPEMTNRELSAVFGQFGEIQYVVLLKDRITKAPKGMGFVKFATAAAASRAAGHFINQPHTGDRRPPILCRIAAPRAGYRANQPKGQEYNTALNEADFYSPVVEELVIEEEEEEEEEEKEESAGRELVIAQAELTKALTTGPNPILAALASEALMEKLVRMASEKTTEREPPPTTHQHHHTIPPPPPPTTGHPYLYAHAHAHMHGHAYPYPHAYPPVHAHAYGYAHMYPHYPYLYPHQHMPPSIPQYPHLQPAPRPRKAPPPRPLAPVLAVAAAPAAAPPRTLPPPPVVPPTEPSAPKPPKTDAPKAKKTFPTGSRLFVTFARSIPADALIKAFKAFGKLDSAFLLPGKNYGYVQYYDADSASAAIRALHNRNIDGVACRALVAEPYSKTRKPHNKEEYKKEKQALLEAANAQTPQEADAENVVTEDAA